MNKGKKHLPMLQLFDVGVMGKKRKKIYAYDLTKQQMEEAITLVSEGKLLSGNLTADNDCVLYAFTYFYFPKENAEDLDYKAW